MTFSVWKLLDIASNKWLYWAISAFDWGRCVGWRVFIGRVCDWSHLFRNWQIPKVFASKSSLKKKLSSLIINKLSTGWRISNITILDTSKKEAHKQQTGLNVLKIFWRLRFKRERTGSAHFLIRHVIFTGQNWKT